MRPASRVSIARDAIASGDGNRLACISVNVQPWGDPVVRASWGVTTDCEKAAQARLPKCAMSDVAKHFPGDDASYSIHYNAKGWRVGHHTNDAIIATFDDDC